MKTRAFLLGVMAVVSLTSGCACWNSPCWGFRLHPCATCSPAYSSPVAAPVAAPVMYPGPVGMTAGPDCPCNGGGMAAAPPVAFSAPQPSFPAVSYTPVVGTPMPLPGSTSVIPSIMPGKN